MLTIQDLQEDTRDLKQVNHGTCKLVLASCQELVKNANNSGQTSVVFFVPAMVEGRPAMPCRKIALYIQDRLMKGGISAKLLSENLVYVDWTPSHAHKATSSHVKPRKPADKSHNADESHKLRRRLMDFRRRAEGWIKA